MSIPDVILLAVIFLALIAAVTYMVRCRRTRKCIGCTGDCACCGYCKK